MGGVAGDASTPHVDDKIKRFQRNLADQNGAFVGKLRNVCRAVTALNC